MAGRSSRFFDRNKAWLTPGEHSYNTTLEPAEEQEFQHWIAQNAVPFDPAAAETDYDMRGFWKALKHGDPMATTAVNPNDGKMHFPDYWKTPYHQSFSADSQWADKGSAPIWNERDQLVTHDGKVIFDERAQRMDSLMQKSQQDRDQVKSVRSGAQ